MLKKRGNSVKYYDSFGGVPLPKEFMNSVGPKVKIIYNRHQFPDYGWGQLCIQFLKSLKA